MAILEIKDGDDSNRDPLAEYPSSPTLGQWSSSARVCGRMWTSGGRPTAAIKALADARYDGDLDRAYDEVLNRGLEYSALPTQERLTTGDGANVEFIPTEGAGEPVVFHKLLGRSSTLYSVGHGPHTTIKIEELTERLSTISRYAGVGVEGAAFGLRRPGGSWVGWGFGDFLAALSNHSCDIKRRSLSG